jgi:hypothetical protein
VLVWYVFIFRLKGVEVTVLTKMLGPAAFGDKALFQFVGEAQEPAEGRTVVNARIVRGL